jgi:hypothetical protein
VKVAGDGTSQWTRSYERPDNQTARSVQQAPNGAYVITGYVSDAGNLQIANFRSAEGGFPAYMRLYGGAGTEFGWYGQLLSDGGCIVAGETWSYGSVANLYLVRTNRAGNVLWTKVYGGKRSSWARFVQPTSDGGFIVVGQISSSANGSDVWLLKTNSQGDTLWTKTFGGSHGEEGYCVRQVADGGYIVTGATGSFSSNHENDLFLLRTDATGNLLWMDKAGGINSDIGYSVLQTSDGEYLVAGLRTPDSSYSGDMWLVRWGPD